MDRVAPFFDSQCACCAGCCTVIKGVRLSDAAFRYSFLPTYLLIFQNLVFLIFFVRCRISTCLSVTVNVDIFMAIILRDV